MTMLDMIEDHFCGHGERTEAELLDGIRYARGRGECPSWWAEVVYELRSGREERETG